MNNDSFRSLVSSSSKPSTNGKASTSAFQRPAALGSRNRTSIPMTPRNVPGYNANREFALQVAEQTSSSNGEPPSKKFKSSAAPKGTKLGAGYTDRAGLRQVQVAQGGDQTENDVSDKATRLKNLEEQFKLGQIDESHFERLKEQMGIGGDVSSTHLVKGLDWKLLERVRRGEDIDNSVNDNDLSGQASDGDNVDVDEELEKALEREVTAKENSTEAEQVEPTEQQQHQVLTRDEILRRFREQRNAPVVPAAPVLNDKFKKIASSNKPDKRKFIETINGRRREVLIITNKDGTTKRKSRWIDPEDATKPEHQPLGMEVPVEMAAKQKAMLEAEAAEDDNEDIFKDAGDDYDPLAGIESGEDDPDEDQQRKGESDETRSTMEKSGPVKKRNYFSSSRDGNEHDPETDNAFANDPTILAALKRAAQIRQHEAETDGRSEDQSRGHTEVGAKSAAFLARLKEQERQDAADLDYGFGESRLGDEDDEEAGPLYDDEEGEAKKKTGRKRGPKKRKGDKNNVQDVMSAIEGRGQRKS